MGTKDDLVKLETKKRGACFQTGVLTVQEKTPKITPSLGLSGNTGRIERRTS